MTHPTTPKRKCSHCGAWWLAPATSTAAFCSTRCQEADLGRWFAGELRIPGAPLTADDLESPEVAAALEALDASSLLQ